MAFENRRLLFGGCAVLVFTCLLYTAANVLPIWGTGIHDLSGPLTIGLWGECIKNKDGQYQCSSIRSLSPSSYAKIIASRLFITLSCIFQSISILSILLILLVNADSKRIAALLTIAFTIASLISGIIGVAVGITLVLQKNEYTVSFRIGTSAIIAIIALVFNVVGMIIAFIIK